MSKQVTVEELATNLREHLAEVRQGETLLIIEDGKQIASVTPTIVQRGVPYPFRDFDFGSRPKNLTIDGAEVIIAERERERSGLKHKL
jgi:antitoxin (DNA-binding transcriptional repressor) of toxin-antitoxin stability system